MIIKNTPPYFISSLKNVEIECNKITAYKLPDTFDSEKDNVVIYTDFG